MKDNENKELYSFGKLKTELMVKIQTLTASTMSPFDLHTAFRQTSSVLCGCVPAPACTATNAHIYYLLQYASQSFLEFFPVKSMFQEDFIIEQKHWYIILVFL